ncbi:MAG: RHS repeat-associated core domain-containing protein [Rhodanobacter sp.]
MKWRTVWQVGIALCLGVGALAHAADTVTYVYTDPQGTVLAEADAQGNIIARYDYAPYGAPVASLGSPPDGPGYTGHVNDPDTGLVYMQARYYDPAVGRFLSTDPVVPSAGALFGFNRYDYANNNPINHTDPDGRCAEDACVVESGVAIGAAVVYVGSAALVAAGVCAAACQKIHDAIGNTAKSIYDHIVHESRSKPPAPLPEAEGHPHSIPDGKGGYTTYPDGDANNGKQYRPDGKPHGDIERPNVKEWKPNPRNPNGGKGPDIVRKPTPDEIPSQGNQPQPPPPPKSLPEPTE